MKWAVPVFHHSAPDSWYWNVMRVLSPSCGSRKQCFVGNEEICLLQGQKEPPSSLMSVLFPPCPFTCPLNFSYVSKPLLRLSVIGKNVLSFFFSFFSQSTITIPTFPPLIFITESRVFFLWTLLKSKSSPLQPPLYLETLRWEWWYREATYQSNVSSVLGIHHINPHGWIRHISVIFHGFCLPTLLILCSIH